MTSIMMRTGAPGILATMLLWGCAVPTAVDDPVTPGKVYVADEDSGTLSVINDVTFERIATIDLSDAMDMVMPHNVQVAPDGSSVWVAAAPMTEGGEEMVIVVDPLTDTVVDRIGVGTEQHLAHVVLDESSENAFVSANEASEIIHVDVATREVVARHALGVGRAPHGMRVCGDRVYIAEMDGHAITVFDPATEALTNIDVSGIAVQIACTPDGRYVFATLYDTREVVRLDVASQEIVRIALPDEARGPVQAYPSPDSLRLFVADQGILLDRPASNKLFVIDVPTATVIGSVDVGNGAHGVVVNDDGRLAFVTNLLDGTVSVVDTDALVVMDTVGVGQKPNGISHWHVAGGMP